MNFASFLEKKKKLKAKSKKNNLKLK
jgi:hypothetical protein